MNTTDHTLEDERMQQSKIQWTDHTFNPWIGCTKVHQGCENCYAEADMDKRRGRVKWGPNGTRSKTSEDYWKQPLKWNKQAAIASAISAKCAEFDAAGVGQFQDRAEPIPYHRPRVFCSSLADVFEDWDGPIVDHHGETLLKTDRFGELLTTAEGHRTKAYLVTMNDLRSDLFKLIDATPNLDWLLLTKRPENIRKMWRRRKQHESEHYYCEGPHYNEELGEWVDGTHRCNPELRSNVWLGTSVSDQATADKMIPELLQCRDLAAKLFVSYEPALGAVDFSLIPTDPGAHIWANVLTGVYSQEWAGDHENPPAVQDYDGGPKLDWIIVGGESGSNARPCNTGWIESTIEQCKAAGVACFVKQFGSNPTFRSGQPIQDEFQVFINKNGAEPSEWPEWARVQEFPKA